MSDFPKADSFTAEHNFKVVNARTVKVQPVHDFQTFLQENIDFGSLRQAVMIKDKLLIGPQISTQMNPEAVRQWYSSVIIIFHHNHLPSHQNPKIAFSLLLMLIKVK